MKKIILLIIMGMTFIFVSAQVQDVNPSPVDVKNPYAKQTNLLDVLYNYPLYDTALTSSLVAAETDGDYFYLAPYKHDTLIKLDMFGNLVERFTIPGVDSLRDLTYDGEYFYATRHDAYVYKLDMQNKQLLQVIEVNSQWQQTWKSIAYNSDLNLFYLGDYFGLIFTADSSFTTVEQMGEPLDGWIYGMAYDNWSDGGPYLWAFSQDWPDDMCMLHQLQLPDCTPTGYSTDLSYLNSNIHPELTPVAGGLFSYVDTNNIAVLGGVVQVESLFGIKLKDLNPPILPSYAVNYLHAELIDSSDVQLSWSPAVFYMLNEYFAGDEFPPAGWESISESTGWQYVPADGSINPDVNLEVPDWDSDYLIAGETPENPDACCDYLITPQLELNSYISQYLSFESYFDGSNNQSAYVEYSIDNGNSWNVLYTLSADQTWKKISIGLAPILSEDLSEGVKIAFHADDNGGAGSGWAIDNVMIHSDDITLDLQGYDIYRNNTKINTNLLTGTSFYDSGLSSGSYKYHVKSVFDQDIAESAAVYINIPDIPPPPVCYPPQSITAEVTVNHDIKVFWQKPQDGYNYIISGYNLYLNNELYNSVQIADTFLTIPDSEAGIWELFVTALYQNEEGQQVCESEMAGPFTVEVEEGFLMGGNVFAGTQKMDAGKVYVYRVEQNEITQSHEAEVNELGYFFLPQLNVGNYLMQAKPQKGSAYFTSYAPTYKGGKLHWENAETLSFEHTSYSNDVELIKLQSQENGTAGVSGQVHIAGNDNPVEVEDISILLLTQNGNCIAAEYTDASGNFKFKDLAYGTYKILVEITGKSMEPYVVALNSNLQNVSGLNFVVEDNEVYLGVEEALPAMVDHISDIFPNPANETAALKISAKENTIVTLQLYNLQGQLLQEKDYPLEMGSNEIEFEVSMLKQGVYYLDLKFVSNVSIGRKLLVFD